MRGISLWQPWATLIAIGAKRHETRSWYTPYRGPLAIHAAKRCERPEMRLLAQEPFRTALHGIGIYLLSQLPFGAIVALADLAECVPTTELRDGLSSQEWAFGDYSPGRWAWCLRNVYRLPEPIPYRGAQGLWPVPADVERRIEWASCRSS